MKPMTFFAVAVVATMVPASAAYSQAVSAPNGQTPPTAGTTAVPAVPGQSPQSAADLALAKTQGEVLQNEKDRFKAIVKADVNDLQHLLAPELRYTHTNAQMQDRAGFIADIRSGAIKYLSIEPAEIDVQVFGTTAIVTGTATMHVIENGNDLTIKIRYTNVQLNRNGGWQMAAWQATRVPQP